MSLNLYTKCNGNANRKARGEFNAFSSLFPTGWLLTFSSHFSNGMTFEYLKSCFAARKLHLTWAWASTHGETLGSFDLGKGKTGCHFSTPLRLSSRCKNFMNCFSAVACHRKFLFNLQLLLLHCFQFRWHAPIYPSTRYYLSKYVSISATPEETQRVCVYVCVLGPVSIAQVKCQS